MARFGGSFLFELRFDGGHDLIPHVDRINQGIEPGAAGLPVLGRLDKRARQVELIAGRHWVRNDVRAPLPELGRDGR